MLVSRALRGYNLEIMAGSAKSFIIVLFLLVSILACRKQGPDTAEASQAGPGQGRETEAFLEIYCTDLVGSVETMVDGIWTALAEGSALNNHDSVRTGPQSSCKLVFSTLAVVDLLSDTGIKINHFLDDEEKRLLDLFVHNGTVLNLVKRLEENDLVVIRSSSAISTVKGTSFLLSNDPYYGSSIAVDSGKVAVLPSSPLLENLVDSSMTSTQIARIFRFVADRAVILEKGQELTPGLDALLIPTELEAELEGAIFAPEGFLPDKLIPALARLEKLVSDSKSFNPLVISEDKSEKLGLVSAAETAEAYAPSGWDSLMGGIAGNLIRVPQTGVFVLSDSDGNLTGINEEGRLLWFQKSNNRNADRSYPVPFKGLVYYSGSRELLIIDSLSGELLSLELLEGDRTHADGTRTVPFPGAIISPARETLEVRDEKTGKVERSIPVPDGLSMTPVNYNGMAAVVNQKGVFMLLDMTSGAVRASVQTNAGQTIALAPRIYGNYACFADRKGLLVMVKLEPIALAWEHKLPGSSGVFSDIEISDAGVFAFSKDTVYSFSLEGIELMEPLSKVSAPPLLSRGILYYGTLDAFLVALRVSDGKELGRVAIGSKASARPLYSDGAIYIGTSSGKLVKVDASIFTSY